MQSSVMFREKCFLQFFYLYFFFCIVEDRKEKRELMQIDVTVKKHMIMTMKRFKAF